MDSPIAPESESSGLQDQSEIRNSAADNFANSLQLTLLPSRDHSDLHERLAYPCTWAFDSEFSASQPSTSPTPVTEESQRNIVLTIENTSASARKAIVEIVMQDGGSVRLSAQ